MTGSARFVRVLVASLMVAGGSFAPAAADASAAALQIVERPAHRPVVLRWEAQSDVSGTHFVVLRGAPGQRMVAIGLIDGHPGRGLYRFEDSSTVLTETRYELRGVDASGRAVTLKTILLRPTFDLRPLERPQNSAPQPAALAADALSLPLADARPRESETAGACRLAAVSSVPDPPPWSSSNHLTS